MPAFSISGRSNNGQGLLHNSNVEATMRREEVITDLTAALATPSDLDKLDRMLADAVERERESSRALSDLIARHTSQLRSGWQHLSDAVTSIEAVRERLAEIRSLCNDVNVLSLSETRQAAELATVQGNIVKTISGVQNIYQFPERAKDAMGRLWEVDEEPAVLLDVFWDLSTLLSTQAAAKETIASMYSSASQVDIRKVEGYFTQVQQVSTAFQKKLMSYFDDVVATAQQHPAHLVVALRIVLTQEATLRRNEGVDGTATDNAATAAAAAALSEGRSLRSASSALSDSMRRRRNSSRHASRSGEVKDEAAEAAEAAARKRNPWACSFKQELVMRMHASVEKQLRQVVVDAEHVYAQWLRVHRRPASAFFDEANKSEGAPADATVKVQAMRGVAGMLGGAGDRGSDGFRAASRRYFTQATSILPARGAPTGGAGSGHGEASDGSTALRHNGMDWLQRVETDERAMEAMRSVLDEADEASTSLAQVYDDVRRCFPPSIDPVEIYAAAYTRHVSYILDALGQAAPAYDNLALLAFLSWPDAYKRMLLGLGLPDEVVTIDVTPRIGGRGKPSAGLHGLVVARLVYVDRTRRQLEQAFRNLVTLDLLKAPEPNGDGRLWSPGIIEMFRFLSEQVSQAASVNDADVMRHLGQVAMQVMVRYQELVKGEVDRKGLGLGFEMFVALVNTNLIAYDQCNDLALAIDGAIARESGVGALADERTTAGTDISEVHEGGTEHELLEAACRGFLDLAKHSLQQAVSCIFADPGIVDLLGKLYCSEDWKTGTSTQSCVLTLNDYLGDLKNWLDGPFYKRAVLAIMTRTIAAFRDAFMTQMPRGSLREAEDGERLEADVYALKDFFSNEVPLDQVEDGLEPFEAVVELAAAEDLEQIEERYGFMLAKMPACPIRPADVATIVLKRADFGRYDASAVREACEAVKAAQAPSPPPRAARPHSSGALGGAFGSDDGVAEGGVFAKLYNRVANAVQGAT